MSRGRRVEELPAGWPAKRRRILERDGAICHLCGGPQADEVDHVLAVSEGGDDSDENLAPVHSDCHASKTGREAARARARKYARPRPPEAHPGLVAPRDN